jgi:DNA-binding transcriptional ArsR family regulator
MNIEDVFSSRLRMKILKTLIQLGEVNASEIARRLRINYEITVKHLRTLENEGIVVDKTFGRVRLYRLRESSAKTKAVQALFEAWEHYE